MISDHSGIPDDYELLVELTYEEPSYLFFSRPAAYTENNADSEKI